MDRSDLDRAGRRRLFLAHRVRGVDEVGNAVEIGIEPDGFDEGVSRIRKALSGAGDDDPGMFCFVPAYDPAWDEEF